MRPIRVVSAVLAALVVTPASAAEPTRYSLAGGCWTLSDASGKALGQQLRLQATGLGSYLLYTPDKRFLGAGFAPADAPSPATDWVVQDAGDGAFTLASKAAPDTKVTGRFAPATGCADYPEAELNATGTPFRGPTPYGTVNGWMDGHLHWMNFELLGGEFKCGKPWDPYGIPYALPDCSSVEGPQGSAAPLQNTLVHGNPADLHDTTGWPKLSEWSKESIGTSHEGTYWRWLQRAWMSGMRLLVMPVNDNRVLCELYPRRKYGCSEMATVTRALDDLQALEDYADAEAGGPGKGFFRIVRDPFEARRAINAGKLAVVEEIEISELFDCKGYETSNCSKETIDKGLQAVYDKGVRSMLLLNKFDNPLTGVRFDSGPIGVVINAGNRSSSGSFWSARTCTNELHDNAIESGNAETSALAAQILGSAGLGEIAPAYPPAPHCNTRGLTDLGKYTVEQMIAKGMIVNPDHMSQKAVDQTLTIAEAHDYAGVISPHGWMDPGNWPRIWKLGGLVRYAGGGVDGYVKEWRKFRPVSSPYLLGSAMGTDIAGLFAQPGPSEDAAKVMTYPFKSIDGKVTFDKQRTGDRVFDYTKEGIAHYGEYADWLEDLRLHAPPKLISDFMDGAEAYLDMWERAEGVRGPACVARDIQFSPAGLRNLRLGAAPDALLRAAGQPQARTRAWSWCVRGDGKRAAADTAVMTPAGTVGLVASTAHDHNFRDLVGPGDPVAQLAPHAKPLGPDLYVRPAGDGATYVFRVSHGVVRTVGVATREVASSRTRLLRYLRLVRPRVRRPAPLVLNPAAATARTTAPAALAAGSGATDRSVYLMLCALSGAGPAL